MWWYHSRAYFKWERKMEILICVIFKKWMSLPFVRFLTHKHQFIISWDGFFFSKIWILEMLSSIDKWRNLSRPLAKLIDNVAVKVKFPNLPHASKLCFNFPIPPRRSSAIEIERKYLVSIFSVQMDSLKRNI